MIIKKNFSYPLKYSPHQQQFLKHQYLRPESVSSKIDNFGASNDICKISFFFFSPPEKPTFNCLFNFSSSNFLSSFAFSFTNFKNSIASSSFSPLAFFTAFKEVFKNIFVLTPGISKGY